MPTIIHNLTDRKYAGKKLAVVFKDKNGKWMGASLPFPALEMYGVDRNGNAVCVDRKQAVEACCDGEVDVIVSKDQALALGLV